MDGSPLQLRTEQRHPDRTRCPSRISSSPPSSTKSPTASRSRARTRFASAPIATPRAPSRNLQRDVKQMIERGETLAGYPASARTSPARSRRSRSTGSCDVLQRLRQEMPAAITELLEVPGLGPKRVKMLWHDLDVQTPEQVLRAARDGRIRDLHGFGEKTETQHRAGGRRPSVQGATHEARGRRAVRRGAGRVPEGERPALAGRRRRQLPAHARHGRRSRHPRCRTNGRAITERFVRYPDVAEVLAQGATRASVRLRGGLQVDLRVVPAASFGAALPLLHRLQGAQHRAAPPRPGARPQDQRVRRLPRREAHRRRHRGVGLRRRRPAVHPAGAARRPRRDRGRARGATAGAVEYARSQGRSARAHRTRPTAATRWRRWSPRPRRSGFEYLAITEHSRRQAMSHGLDPERLARQIARDRPPERAAARYPRAAAASRSTSSTTARLDLPDEVLARLDVVVAAVHSQFDLSRAQQTERILRALDHPHVTLLAHPTGRLIGEREPYDVDMLQIVRKAKARGDPSRGQRASGAPRPHRYALPHVQGRGRAGRDQFGRAQHAGVRHLRYGVGQARRGWLTRDDVLNTRSLSQLLPLLHRAEAKKRVAATGAGTRPVRSHAPHKPRPR